MTAAQADVTSKFPKPIALKTTLLNQGSSEEKRQEILEYFHKSFDLYESLFECLANDDAYTRRANPCLLYTSPSPRDRQKSRMPSSA